MKCLHTNDWHFWHLTPSSRLDVWAEALSKKLDQIAEIAQAEGCGVIAVAGDIFHSVNTSFALVNSLISWARTMNQAGIVVAAIPGNHDLRYNRLDSLNTTPMGTLFKSGTFTDVSFNPITVDGVTIAGMPWPDAKHLERWQALAEMVPKHQPAVVLAHAFASMIGGQFFGQPVMSYAALSALPFRIYHFGHDHSAKASMRIGNKVFLNFGALGRGSLAAEELTRDVKVAITEILPGDDLPNVKFLKLKVAPVSEIFDLGRYAFEKDIAEKFESGLGQQISADFLAMAETGSLADRVALLDVDDAVRARIQAYLVKAEESVA